ncbi:hypothetical protein [Usitatibacter rugosus]|uniref:hypothetical protein n=1 Tax=Usitatibacter rugosus TaxID=2732067 RepID=UPI001488D317|nr:hypothetical protein [Usitatibacter rugosus]
MLHIVDAAAALATMPGVSSALVKAHIHFEDDDPMGNAHVAFTFMKPAYTRELSAQEKRRVLQCCACGPLGFFRSREQIGMAILEGRQREQMSEVDCKLAGDISAIDQFVMGAVAFDWLTLYGHRIGELHKLLTSWAVRFHGPLAIPVSAVCPPELAGRLLRNARAQVPHCLPPAATFLRIAGVAA